MPKHTKKIALPGRTSSEIFERVSGDIDRFMSKTPVPKYDLKRDALSKEVRIESPMFAATLYCREEELELVAQLGLLAMPFRGKLDEGLELWVKKAFTPRA
jgi:hypothetical protein